MSKWETEIQAQYSALSEVPFCLRLSDYNFEKLFCARSGLLMMVLVCVAYCWEW